VVSSNALALISAVASAAPGCSLAVARYALRTCSLPVQDTWPSPSPTRRSVCSNDRSSVTVPDQDGSAARANEPWAANALRTTAPRAMLMAYL
jgi:hypothetical protein